MKLGDQHELLEMKDVGSSEAGNAVNPTSSVGGETDADRDEWKEEERMEVEGLEDKYFSTLVDIDSNSPRSSSVLSPETVEEKEESAKVKDGSKLKMGTLSSSMFAKIKERTQKRFTGFGAGRTPWVVRNRYFYSEQFLILLVAIIFIAWVMLGMI